jgi:DNA-binding XRE family transcriptional regulator
MADRPHHRGAQLLRTWRTKQEVNQQEAADRIGVDLARYNAFENERARPGLDWAVKIEQISKGAVPVSSWAVDPMLKAKAS